MLFSAHGKKALGSEAQPPTLFRLRVITVADSGAARCAVTEVFAVVCELCSDIQRLVTLAVGLNLCSLIWWWRLSSWLSFRLIARSLELSLPTEEQEQPCVSLVLWRRHFGVVFTKQKLKSDSSSGVLVSTLSHDSWPKSHSFFPRLGEIGVGTVVPNNSEETEP